MRNYMRRFIALALSLILCMSMGIQAFAMEYNNPDTQIASTETEDMYASAQQSHIADISVDVNVLSSNVEIASAGLAFGPVTVGNITFRVTNSHSHNIPGYGIVEHINFHIDNADTGKEIKNYHIFTQMNANGKECLVVYESKSATEVFRNCNDTLGSQVSAFFSIVSEIVSGLLSEANFITATAIIAVIVVLVVDLVLPLDPLPFLPASMDTMESIA